jgi:hypothetical protein
MRQQIEKERKHRFALFRGLWGLPSAPRACLICSFLFLNFDKNGFLSLFLSHRNVDEERGARAVFRSRCCVSNGEASIRSVLLLF